MRKRQNLLSIVWLSLLLQLVAARTVVHYTAEFDSDGEAHTKTSTTQDSDDDSPISTGAEEDGFLTFTRHGITVRYKPQVSTLRIGGKNVSTDELLEKAKDVKDLDLLAVSQLLNTGHSVKRTSFKDGLRRTNTYTLTSDGSILFKKIEDIDIAHAERRIKEILRQVQQFPYQPAKPADGEAHVKISITRESDNDSPINTGAEEDGFRSFTRHGISIRYKPQVSMVRIGGKSASLDQLLDQAKDVKDLDLLAVRQLMNNGHPVKRTSFKDGLRRTNTYTLESDGSILFKKMEDIDIAHAERRIKEILRQGQQLPHQPANLQDKPDEQIPAAVKEPKPESDDIFGVGRPLLSQFPKISDHTGSGNKEPFNLFGLRGFDLKFNNTRTDSDGITVRTSYTFTRPHEWQNNPLKVSYTITTQTLPSWDDFLNSQYNLSKDFNPLNPPTTISTSTTTNAGQTGGDQHVEHIKEHTIPKTVLNNQATTARDLDSNMRDTLKRAGLTSEDINIASKQTITKTHVEPDGRIVTTTFHVHHAVTHKDEANTGL